jgi:tetratricopeptide (TPR) repeat protein
VNIYVVVVKALLPDSLPITFPRPLAAAIVKLLFSLNSLTARFFLTLSNYKFFLFIKIMSKCARPDCQAAANSSCSGCGREIYCSSVCQKLDWKVHKLSCRILKKLSSQLQPYNEVVRITKEILASNKGNDLRVLEHLLSCADYQFGQQVAGRDYRERIDGQRIDNWNVDIEILLQISHSMVEIYGMNSSLSPMIRDKGMFPHIERSLNILSPWMDTIDFDATNQSNSLNSTKSHHLLKNSCTLEHNMAMLALNRNQYDVAERHMHRCLANLRRFRIEGEDKTTSIFEALGLYVNLRMSQGDLSGAVTFAEEAYNLVVDAYDPVHPQVQEVAGWLIDCLSKQGDFSNAERFAEQTYSNLRDIKNGMDQEGEQIAQGACNLANVIFRQDDGDLIKAEGLARESLRIRTRLHCSHSVGSSCILLARLLKKQGEFGDETKELFERSLAIFIRTEGPDGINTAVVNIHIGEFHYHFAMIQSTISKKRMQLQLAKSYSKEAIRIESKIHNPTHPNRVGAISLLSEVLLNFQKSD